MTGKYGGYVNKVTHGKRDQVARLLPKVLVKCALRLYTSGVTHGVHITGYGVHGIRRKSLRPDIYLLWSFGHNSGRIIIDTTLKRSKYMKLHRD